MTTEFFAANETDLDNAIASISGGSDTQQFTSYTITLTASFQLTHALILQLANGSSVTLTASSFQSLDGGGGLLVVNGPTSLSFGGSLSYHGVIALSTGGSVALGNALAGGSVVSFTGPGATLSVVASGNYLTDVISGFANQDAISLAGFDPATTHVTRGAHNLFAFTDGAHTTNLQFDPSQDFSSSGFSFSPDSNGNTRATLVTNAAPVISQTTDVAVAGDATGAPLPISGFSNDALDGNDPVIYTDNGQTVPFEQNFAVGFHTVTATVTNRSGQTTSATFTATIIDTTGTVPINIGQQTSLPLPGFNLANTHVTRGTNNLFTFTDGLSTTLVQFDAGQNLSTTGFRFVNQTAILDRDSGPTIQEKNLVVAGTSSGASVSFPGVASDILDGSLPINFTENGQTAFPGETFAPGTHRIDATATNRSGQTATTSFTISVIDTTGQIPFDAGSFDSLDLPTFNPATTHATRGANNLFTFTDGLHTALVQFDPARSLSQTGFSFASDSLGGTTIQLVANTGPTISRPADQIIEAAGPSGAAVQFSATTQDPVDGSDPLIYRENGRVISPGDTFAIGVHPIIVTTVDRSGFTASSAFSITVRDTTPPAISTSLRTGFDYTDNLSLPLVDVEATRRGGADITFSSIISAFDIVDGPVTLTFAQNGKSLSQTQYAVTPYGSTFYPGDNVVVATVTDSHGNSSTLTFDVRVSDYLTPFLTVPNLYVSTNGAGSAVPNLPASVPDLVYGSAPVTYYANGKQIAAGQSLAPGHYGVFGEPINPAGVPSYDRFEIFVSKNLKDFSAQTAGVYVDLGAGFDLRESKPGVGWTDPVTALANGAARDRFSGITDVVGSAYADRLYGTTGDNNFLPGTGSDIIYGNGGRDTVDYLSLKAGVYVDLAHSFALKAKTANIGWQDPSSAEASGFDTDYLGNITNVFGTNFNDRLYGRTEGGTTFSPGLGNDIIYGSGSNNTVDYSTSGDAVYADLAAGYALKLTNGGWRTDVEGILNPYTGSFRRSSAGPNGQNLEGGHTDVIFDIQNIIGSQKDDRLYGTSGDNIFTPGAGNDTIYGQGGNDTVNYSTLSAGVYVDLGSS